MDELRAISSFVRAAELGSFQKAAEAQNTTPQAVSKAIRQLEQQLGIRLFHRTTRKSSLTQEGERLLASVKPNLEGLIGALSSTRGAAKDNEGIVRVAAGGAVGRKVLIPLLAEFQQRFPLIQIDLMLEERFSDLVAERIDVGFRAGNPPESQIVSRRLFSVQQIVCAAPAYLAQHAKPKTSDELRAHRCTAYRQPGSGRPMPWEFEINGDTRFWHPAPALCCNDPEAEMQAVAAGMGIGQIDSINAAAAIRSGALVPLMTDSLSERMGLYLYYAHRSDMPGRVRHFIDFTLERLRDSTDFYLSRAELAAAQQSRKPRKTRK
jgi:DNA-binding transcriptional LysR family regulator